MPPPPPPTMCGGLPPPPLPSSTGTGPPPLQEDINETELSLDEIMTQLKVKLRKVQSYSISKCYKEPKLIQIRK